MKNNLVEKCLRDIAAKHGGMLLPEHVVETARAKNHPLHDRFTWDNSEAAEQYRLQEARQLIRVTVEILGDGLEPSPVFVSLSPDRTKGRGYRPMVEVMSDVQLREQLLKDALHEANQFARRYSQLKQLSELFRAIKKVSRKAA